MDGGFVVPTPRAPKVFRDPGLMVNVDLPSDDGGVDALAGLLRTPLTVKMPTLGSTALLHMAIRFFSNVFRSFSQIFWSKKIGKLESYPRNIS